MILEENYGIVFYRILGPYIIFRLLSSLPYVDNLYFGTYDKKFEAVKNGAKFYKNKFVNFRPKIYESIEKDDYSMIIKDFFRDLRVNKKIKDPQRSNL